MCACMDTIDFSSLSSGALFDFGRYSAGQRFALDRNGSSARAHVIMSQVIVVVAAVLRLMVLPTLR